MNLTEYSFDSIRTQKKNYVDLEYNIMPLCIDTDIYSKEILASFNSLLLN
jgi:hypothetical protein